MQSAQTDPVRLQNTAVARMRCAATWLARSLDKWSPPARKGDPVQVLVRVAREQDAPLIVTGWRGRNVLATAVLGSVTAALVATPADRSSARRRRESLVPPRCLDFVETSCSPAGAPGYALMSCSTPPR